MMSLQTTVSSRIHLRSGDLEPQDFEMLARSEVTAWDIETTGLNYTDDAIGTVQIADDSGQAWLVKIDPDRRPELLCLVLANAEPLKVFHFAPFDLGFMRAHWGVRAQNVACTKVLDRLVNPEEKSHSLKDVLSRSLGVVLDKEQSVRRSNWMAESLTPNQLEYAVKDVAFLIPLFENLMEKAAKHGVSRLAQRSFDYLPVRVETEHLGLDDLYAY